MSKAFTKDDADVVAVVVAPRARAMLGKRVGDVPTVKTPHGEEELTVVALAYDHE